MIFNFPTLILILLVISPTTPGRTPPHGWLILSATRWSAGVGSALPHRGRQPTPVGI
jgi:hypothetical protein